MVFFGDGVVCFCGFDFIVEVTNCFAFSIKIYLYIPFLSVFVPSYTLVFRIKIIRLNVSSVAAVLLGRCRAQVCFSIIEAVMVDMVNEKMVGRVDYFTMHPNTDSFFVGPDSPAGIKSA